MDYKYQICKKLQENPSSCKVEFTYEGKKWQIELNRYESGLYAFICKDGLLDGQFRLDYSQDEFLDDLKAKEGVEDLRIDILEFFPRISPGELSQIEFVYEK